MAKQILLKAVARSGAGKSQVKKLRRQGMVPAVIYGPHTTPRNLAVRAFDLDRVLQSATGENVLVSLQVEGGEAAGSHLALIQEVQHHPVNDSLLHVDFREVSATEKMRTAVPVRPVGEAAGVKTGGGILEMLVRELRVECLPADLPDVIEVNVERLQVGQSIHVGEITPPPGVTLLDDKDQPVFLVVAPITEEEEAAIGQPAEMAEPEVIGAKKEEPAAAAEGEKKPEAKPKEAAKAEAPKPEAKK